MRYIKNNVTYLISIIFILLCFLDTINFISSTSESEIVATSPLELQGTIFHVGGNGPGNYSNIQAAVNHSSNGDTIYVYAASSPYYENIVINKSITVIGEDMNTTVIDGRRIDDPIWIKSSNVAISGFMILNSPDEDSHAGIYVIEKKWWEPDNPPWLTNINISNCVLKNNSCGIRLYSTSYIILSACIFCNNTRNSIYISSSSHVIINGCKITNNGDVYSGGIIVNKDSSLWNSNNVSVSNCSISNNYFAGIWILDYSCDIKINLNDIYENTNGIVMSHCNANIYENHIHNNGASGFFDAGVFIQDCVNKIKLINNTIDENNQYGVYLLRSSGNLVNRNNLIQNNFNAFFCHFSLLNHWDGNYWSDWIGLGPKLIIGKLGEEIIPWVNFDWHPTKTPFF